MCIYIDFQCDWKYHGNQTKSILAKRTQQNNNSALTILFFHRKRKRQCNERVQCCSLSLAVIFRVASSWLQFTSFTKLSVCIVIGRCAYILIDVSVRFVWVGKWDWNSISPDSLSTHLTIISKYWLFVVFPMYAWFGFCFQFSIRIFFPDP